MPRRTLWIVLGAIVVSLLCYQRADRNPYGRWFAEVIEAIDRNYVEPVDDAKLFEGALRGMLGRLDDYSAFFPRQQAVEFEEELDQEYGGVGIEVALEGEEKQLTIVTPMVGTPAYKAGLKARDKIVAIDGRPTQGLQLRDIVGLLRGRAGAEVTLRIARRGLDQPLDFRLERARIQTLSVLGDSRQEDGSWSFLLPGPERIGYVRIISFGKSTLDELQAAMRWLSERKCRGLILDLRNNPGGLLESGQETCDLFLPAGALIVTTRGRDARERDRYEASGRGPYFRLPLVVLVNDRSASASEIVAACLQDHGRATIVGQRTWGKGTVQSVIPLEGGQSLLKLTIASYWRPSGQNIHRLSSSREEDPWGVHPDPGCEVKLDDHQAVRMLGALRPFDQPGGTQQGRQNAESAPKLRGEVDPQFARALEVLRAKLGDQSTDQAAARAD